MATSAWVQRLPFLWQAAGAGLVAAAALAAAGVERRRAKKTARGVAVGSARTRREDQLALIAAWRHVERRRRHGRRRVPGAEEPT